MNLPAPAEPQRIGGGTIVRVVLALALAIGGLVAAPYLAVLFLFVISVDPAAGAPPPMSIEATTAALALAALYACVMGFGALARLYRRETARADRALLYGAAAPLLALLAFLILGNIG